MYSKLTGLYTLTNVSRRDSQIAELFKKVDSMVVSGWGRYFE